MARSKTNTATIDPTPEPTTTAIALDLGKQPTITLIPLPLRRRVEQMIADAGAIIVIGGRKALDTADTLASAMKAVESEIAETCKGQLAPIKGLLKVADSGVKAVLDALEETRLALAKRVVDAKVVLGVEETTSCYASTVDDLKILEAHKVPRTVKLPIKGGVGFEEIEILVIDQAAVKRAWKAGVAVPGTYLGSKQQIGVKSA